MYFTKSQYIRVKKFIYYIYSSLVINEKKKKILFNFLSPESFRSFSFLEFSSNGYENLQRFALMFLQSHDIWNFRDGFDISRSNYVEFLISFHHLAISRQTNFIALSSTFQQVLAVCNFPDTGLYTQRGDAFSREMKMI